MQTSRQALLDAILSDMRAYSAHTQHIGHAFASLNNFGQADLHALTAIMEAERAGDPLTAGALAHELNYSTSAVTALIDRLEAGGHVYRDRDAADRRKIFLRYAELGEQIARGFFGPLTIRATEVMDQFSEDELAIVHRFMCGMVDSMRQQREALRGRAG